MAGIITVNIGIDLATVVKADIANIWIAWGTGDSAWDALGDHGESLVTTADTALFAENFRLNIASVEFIDAFDAISVTPTNRLEFIGTLGVGINPVEIREFGLFGSATAVTDSGNMFFREIFCIKDRSVSSPLEDFTVRVTY